MIKVGFICEGQSDKIILSSKKFKTYLTSIGIDIIDDIIDAEGCGNLLPHNIEEYLLRLESKGAEKIIIIRDKDEHPCFTSIKNTIKARKQDIVIVPEKELETWFLANTNAMRLLFNNQDFVLEYPENEAGPFEKINQLLVEFKGRGIGKKTAGKAKLAQRLVSLDIDIQEAASHPNCPSARYFIDKLHQIAAN